MKDFYSQGNTSCTNPNVQIQNTHSFRFTLLILLLAFCYTSSTAQYLKADGKRIVDENDQEIILRGIGLGGWMLQEGYMLRTSGAQHEIEAKITDLVGEDKKEVFYDAWLQNHCTKRDIDSMASWGYNSVRLPMHYKLFTPPIEEEPVAGQITWNEKGFDMVDDLVSWVKANDMYLILDLHAAPGGQGENADISDYDPSKPSLWESTANQDKMIALWKKLAERYADEPSIGAYDIINEPNWGFENHESDLNGCAESKNTALWNIQKRVTEAIREVDQNHMIIIEGNCWGNNYNGLPTLWDNNLAISFHKYWNGNDQGSIQGMLNMRNNRNAPIWLGETGENSNAWFTDAIDLFETNDMGWSWWPLKKMGGNNPLQVEVKQGYQDILNYWSGSAGKPSEEDAYASLMELAEGLKVENNVYHPDVVDAMIRQPHSDETIPFKDNTLSKTAATRIYAVDYDLGREGFAYHDAEYTNETGNAGGLTWNQGYAYRNDGVDIQESQDSESNGYNIGWTEDGEWLVYTLDVDSSGVYQIDLRYASGSDNSAFSIHIDDSNQTGTVSLPNSGGYTVWDVYSTDDVVLYEGTQKLKLMIEKGGFNLSYLEFTLKKKLSDVLCQAKSGYTSENGDLIYLSVNKTVDASTISDASAFTLQAGETAITPTAVMIDSDNNRQLVLEVNGNFNDATTLSLDYTGDDILATDGTSLSTFEALHITNNLPLHILLPAKIEAEDYYYNNGLEHETTTDTGGGENLGYTNTGDYLDYHIAVSATDTYRVEARIASGGSAGKLAFEQLDDSGQVLNSETIDVPVTGDWQTWQTISLKMTLNEGRGTLRIKVIQPEFNMNWFNFSAYVLSTEANLDQNPVLIYPNPSQDTLHIRWNGFDKTASLKIVNINGSVVLEQKKMKVEEFEAFDISTLKSGHYILEIKSGKEIRREKFIKN